MTRLLDKIASQQKLGELNQQEWTYLSTGKNKGWCLRQSQATVGWFWGFTNEFHWDLTKKYNAECTSTKEANQPTAKRCKKDNLGKLSQQWVMGVFFQDRLGDIVAKMHEDWTNRISAVFQPMARCAQRSSLKRRDLMEQSYYWLMFELRVSNMPVTNHHEPRILVKEQDAQLDDDTIPASIPSGWSNMAGKFLDLLRAFCQGTRGLCRLQRFQRG